MEFGSAHLFCYEISEDEMVPDDKFKKKMKKRSRRNQSSSSSSDEGEEKLPYQRSESVAAVSYKDQSEIKELTTVTAHSLLRNAVTPGPSKRRFGFETPSASSKVMPKSCPTKQKRPKRGTSDIINHYFPEIRKSVSFNAIFPYLVKNDLIYEEEKEMFLLQSLTPTSKLDNVLFSLPRKGADAMTKFIASLRASAEATDHNRIADLLEAAWTKKKSSKRVLRFTKDHGAAKFDGIRTRRADTNVIAILFNTILEPKDVHTGDPVICENPKCEAVLSHLSKLEYDKKKVWNCEFCGAENHIDLVPEGIPCEEDTAYLLSPSTKLQKAKDVSNKAMVVFCMDISGSMSVTSEVPGIFSTNEQKRLRMLSTEYGVDPQTQATPLQKRGFTYVPRLQSVKIAVDKQLSDLSQTNPAYRVALITFNDEVNIIGDGTGEEIIIAGDRLYNLSNLDEISANLKIPQIVGKTRQLLQRKLFALTEGGQTALGPALHMSILLAGKVPGSKVIICTDGLANVGVGSLDDITSDAAFSSAQIFYQELAETAAQKGVTVSVVTIKGTECRILELGQVASNTGGKVTLVDPTTLSHDFKGILDDPVIATNVTTRIVLSNQLYIRQEGSQESSINVQRGNVKADTEISYEFGVKKDGKGPSIMTGEKAHLPLQLQISYTTQDGAQNMKVYTRKLPVTRSRESAEKGMNVAIIGSHAVRVVAALASEGCFAEARLAALCSETLLRQAKKLGEWQSDTYDTVMDTLIPLENTLFEKQQTLDTLGKMQKQKTSSSPNTRTVRSPGVLTSPSPQFYSPSTVIHRQRRALDDETAKELLGMRILTSCSPQVTPTPKPRPTAARGSDILPTNQPKKNDEKSPKKDL